MGKHVQFPSAAQDHITEIERRRNRVRFRWHEAVLRDGALHRSPTAVRLAGHMMHRYDPKQGHAQFSIGSAAKELALPPRTIVRAKMQLVRRGWLRLKQGPQPGSKRWQANFYTLGGGPGDLLFDDPED